MKYFKDKYKEYKLGNYFNIFQNTLISFIEYVLDIDVNLGGNRWYIFKSNRSKLIAQKKNHNFFKIHMNDLTYV